MRFFRLILLGLIAYIVSVLFLFPAAPIVERIEPLIAPVVLNGVDGSALNGRVSKATYDDGIFPIEVSNIKWRFAPQKLLSLMAGVNFSFDAYGGTGQGEFANRHNGDINITDVTFAGPAKGFEALLPFPIAQFSGQLDVNVDTVEIRNQLLQTMRATMSWSDALLEAPFPAALGKIDLDIKPVDDQTHRGFINTAGGDVEISGTVDLNRNGDFRTDVKVTPKSGASPELLNALRGLGRADSSGRYRVQRNGNVNRLM